jgi:hypothetical protein
LLLPFLEVVLQTYIHLLKLKDEKEMTVKTKNGLPDGRKNMIHPGPLLK